MPYPLIVPSAGAGTPTTMPTLSDYVEDLGNQLGSYLRTSVSTTVPGGEPGRWVILDDLKDDENDRAAMAGGWIYVETGTQAGSGRRIRRQGFEGPFGALGLARVLSGNLVPNTTVRVTNPLPVQKVGTTRGLVDLIADSLQRINVRARIPLMGNGSQRYPLTGYSFITSKDQTDGVYDSRWAASGAPTRRSDREYDVTVDGAEITLETAQTYGTSENFELSVLVPAYQVIGTSGTWGFVSTGLVNLTDQTAAPSEWVLPFAMTIGLEYLLILNENDQEISDAERGRRAAGYTRRLTTRWAPSMQEIVQKRLPRRDPDPPRQIVAVTAGWRRRWP